MCATRSTSTKKVRIYAHDYYRCSNCDRYGLEACPNSHKPRADKLEPEMWGFVSNLLKTPDLLRARLGRLIEEERAETPLERAKCGRRSSPRWIASGPRGNSHHGPQGTGRPQGAPRAN